MKLFCQTLAFICLFVLGSQVASAQDIIVKADQTELRAKVLEIEETNIKYKLFDHQDGPTHNIAKQEVFMIIYQSGKRETFTQASAVPAAATSRVSGNSAGQQGARTVNSAAPPNLDLGNLLTLATNPDALGNELFNLVVLAETTPSWGTAGNFLRTGLSSHISYYSGVSSTALLLHLTPQLPVNRLAGNYEKQDIGFFPFLRLGAGAGVTTFTDTDTKTQWSFAHQVAIGADYLFTKKFGVTAYSDKFQTFSCGIIFGL